MGLEGNDTSSKSNGVLSQTTTTSSLILQVLSVT